DGFIRNKEKFVEVTREKILEANIKSKKVVFTVASTKIANREVTIPFVKFKRIKDIIDANASEYFPVEISEYTIAYNVLDKIVDETGKQLIISVLAAPNQLIKNYYSVAELLGYEVEAIDYLGNSIVQSCKRQVGTGIDMIVQVQEESTLLSILEGGVLTLQRTIQHGTESIINTLMNSEYYHVRDEEEALHLLTSNALINRGFLYSQDEVAATIVDYPQEDDYYTRQQIGKKELTESLFNLINNITRVLDYYSSKNGDKKIVTIYLTGQGSKIKGLDDLLNNETGIQVEKIDTLYGVTFSRDINMRNENQGDFLACIGATMNPLNFMPKEYLKTVEKQSLIHTRRVALIGSIVFSGILVLTAYLGYKTEAMEHERLEAQISQLAEASELYEMHKDVKGKYTSIKTMYEVTTGHNDQLTALIKELEYKLPSDCNVVAMNITDTDISLNINTSSKTIVAKVLTQLKTIESLTQVSTANITETRDEGGNVTVSVTVSAQYQSIVEEDTDGNN
ncbi:MAG: pilus assembly protein PilM, partial [Clostridiales bacterium]|nr:pilus assembly protein PilM [Clostridiales bacterium]